MSAKLNAFDTHFVGGGSDILFLVNPIGELSEIPLNKTKNLKKSQKNGKILMVEMGRGLCGLFGYLYGFLSH